MNMPIKRNFIYLIILFMTIFITAEIYTQVSEYYLNLYNIRMVVLIRVFMLFVFGFVLGMSKLLKEKSKEGVWSIQSEFFILAILLLLMSISRIFFSSVFHGTLLGFSYNDNLMVLSFEIISGYLLCISLVKNK